MESLLRLLHQAIQRTSWTQLGTVSTQCSIHVSGRKLLWAHYDNLVGMFDRLYVFYRMSSEEPQNEDIPLRRQSYQLKVYPCFILLHTLS